MVINAHRALIYKKFYERGKIMKKFILGTITGAAIASTVAIAATYTAAPATFKVLVNGKEFTSDPPAMVINDRTYLPLRAIGNALGVPVDWNDELKQAEVGNAEIAKSGYSRLNPAPIGTAQEYTYSSEFSPPRRIYYFCKNYRNCPRRTSL